MVNNKVFRWPKPLFFMVLGAHGKYLVKITFSKSDPTDPNPQPPDLRCQGGIVESCGTRCAPYQPPKGEGRYTDAVVFKFDEAKG